MLGRLPLSALTSVRSGAVNLEGLAPYDEAMRRYLARTGVPSGALTVVRDGRLVHHGVYGVVDDTGSLPSGATRWRVASLSKMWTATAVRVLVSVGQLSYDTPVYPALDIVPAGPVDPRLRRVTVRQLLEHSGGWDAAVGGDPMFRSREIALALGVPSPASMWQTAYFVFGRPLDFDPGTRVVYSNFGYGLLGLLLKRVTGLPYEEAVQEIVLRPVRAQAMALGRSMLRQAGEPTYRMPAAAGRAWSVFDPPGWVAWPYGGFAIETMAAHGGWIASALDLARYARALDERRGGIPLRPEPSPIPTDPWHRYWYVQTGSLPGTFAMIRRDWDGSAYTAACAVFNSRTGDGALDASLSDDLAAARTATSAWPSGADF